MVDNIPGGPFRTRQLHFFFLLDCSKEMAGGGKIQALNNAIRDFLPSIRKFDHEDSLFQVFISIISFSDGAISVLPSPIIVHDFNLPEMEVMGDNRDLGDALSVVAAEIDNWIEEIALTPVIILFFAGTPTDDYRLGIEKLFAKPWGKKALEFGVAIGENCDQNVLDTFMNDPERHPITVEQFEDVILESLVQHFYFSHFHKIDQHSEISPNDDW